MSYGHDDVDDEEAFADRDLEGPRADLGYQEADAPRSRRRAPGGSTRWSFVEVEIKPGEECGVAPLVCAPAPKGCGRSAPTLHADPRSSHPARVICSTCEGQLNAERMARR